LEKVDYLYHYTNTNGLCGIVQTGKFFATDIRFLNDSLEIENGANNLKSIIKSIISKNISKFDKFFDESLEDSHIEDFSNYISDAIVGSRAFSLTDAMNIYVISFCQHKDSYHQKNGLLSQWRGYGSGEGYCLVFEESELKEFIRVHCLSRNLTQKSGSVVYSNYKSMIKDYDSFTEMIIKLVGDVISSEDHVPAPTPFMDTIYDMAIFAKHRAFKEEMEYRFSINVLINDDYDRDISRRFINKDGIVVPSISIGHSGDISRLIKKVIIGPGRNSDEKAIGVDELRRQKQLNFEISVSDTPFR
jgi:hypothetical protein